MFTDEYIVIVYSCVVSVVYRALIGGEGVGGENRMAFPSAFQRSAVRSHALNVDPISSSSDNSSNSQIASESVFFSQTIHQNLYSTSSLSLLRVIPNPDHSHLLSSTGLNGFNVKMCQLKFSITSVEFRASLDL